MDKDLIKKLMELGFSDDEIQKVLDDGSAAAIVAQSDDSYDSGDLKDSLQETFKRTWDTIDKTVDGTETNKTDVAALKTTTTAHTTEIAANKAIASDLSTKVTTLETTVTNGDAATLTAAKADATTKDTALKTAIETEYKAADAVQDAKITANEGNLAVHWTAIQANKTNIAGLLSTSMALHFDDGTTETVKVGK